AAMAVLVFSGRKRGGGARPLRRSDGGRNVRVLPGHVLSVVVVVRLVAVECRRHCHGAVPAIPHRPAVLRSVELCPALPAAGGDRRALCLVGECSTIPSAAGGTGRVPRIV